MAAAFGARVLVELLPIEDIGAGEPMPGASLDALDVAITDYQRNPLLIKAIASAAIGSPFPVQITTQVSSRRSVMDYLRSLGEARPLGHRGLGQIYAIGHSNGIHHATENWVLTWEACRIPSWSATHVRLLIPNEY